MRATHPNGWTTADSRTTRWLTPSWIVEALGEFDLDPCGAPEHDLAARTYLLENGDNGLELPWFGRVWLNPPYGREQEPFMRRLVDHGQGTALIFARTETRSFFETVWDSASAVLFIRGRLTFAKADGGKPIANAGAPSVLVAYGAGDAEALRVSGIAGRFVGLDGLVEKVAA